MQDSVERVPQTLRYVTRICRSFGEEGLEGLQARSRTKEHLDCNTELHGLQ